MLGSEFLATLPLEPSSKREEAIVAAAAAGHFVTILWTAVRSKLGDNSAIFYIMADALRIGIPGDCIRINVSHTGAQRIADILGFSLLTTKLSDLMHAQASKQILPCTQPPDEFMAYTNRMVSHSRLVDSRIGWQQCSVSTVGKDWVLTNRLVGKPDKAANYGWHVPHGSYVGPGGLPVLQPLGLAHNRYHVDYSQVLRMVNRWVCVNGKDMLLEDLLTDPELAPLASDEGTMKIVRHPGVPLTIEVDCPKPGEENVTT